MNEPELEPNIYELKSESELKYFFKTDYEPKLELDIYEFKLKYIEKIFKQCRTSHKGQIRVNEFGKPESNSACLYEFEPNTNF